MVKRIVGVAMIAAAAVAAAAPALAQQALSPSDQVEVWKACVLAKAAQYAVTAEAADTVARAAVLACQDGWTAYVDLLEAGGADVPAAMTSADKTEKRLADRALVAVMEIRSARR